MSMGLDYKEWLECPLGELRAANLILPGHLPLQLYRRNRKIYQLYASNSLIHEQSISYIFQERTHWTFHSLLVLYHRNSSLWQAQNGDISKCPASASFEGTQLSLIIEYMYSLHALSSRGIGSQSATRGNDDWFSYPTQLSLPSWTLNSFLGFFFLRWSH